jgi:hypothetical protein
MRIWTLSSSTYLEFWTMDEIINIVILGIPLSQLAHTHSQKLQFKRVYL